eukprot:CAMPEP_0172159698 /NCGR_PEP_ID=MMETSP1050-20130122/5120_1 /TAXON_ID=233186 /ORGANISM="Cryptomonas curvata, Strain CCAP979/52" /LENGTH=153 /DNA_ID=CAMNT_0012829325 /DNA_START=697 /DNA_END=1158 /DNA_ORIENTATION=+
MESNLLSRINSTDGIVKILAETEALVIASDLILLILGIYKDPKTIPTYCATALKNDSPKIKKILSTLQCDDSQKVLAADGLDFMIGRRNSSVHSTPQSWETIAGKMAKVKCLLKSLGTKEKIRGDNPELYYACWVLEKYNDLWLQLEVTAPGI